MKLVDGNNQVIGYFFFPLTAALQVGDDTVFTGLDIYNRTFSSEGPTFYYASGDCSGPALMYVNLSRYGWVNKGTLHFPQGVVTEQPFNSYSYDADCSPFPGGFGPLASAGQADVSSFVGPFSVKQ